MTTGAGALSNRQRKLLTKRIKAEQAAMPKPEPVAREVYEKPEIRHEDDTIIPGLSGRGAIKRIDTLDRLLKKGKLTGPQFCAGLELIDLVNDFFNSASGLAKLSEEAGKVGGAGDPIRLYVKARPVREGKGYIPTQRPRNPSPARARSDGWTGSKLLAMSKFSRLARLVERLPRDQRQALCVLVIDPSRPDLQPISMGSACRRMFGYSDTNCYDKLARWLALALDEVDAEILQSRREAA